jgi:hypothetical protein
VIGGGALVPPAKLTASIQAEPVSCPKLNTKATVALAVGVKEKVYCCHEAVIATFDRLKDVPLTDRPIDRFFDALAAKEIVMGVPATTGMLVW